MRPALFSTTVSFVYQASYNHGKQAHGACSKRLRLFPGSQALV